eukprot:TRINITY_DN4082_c0_g1_i1.p1 TRINITY_DN4082_c0_g1~~TRINITY_DN4082_c0_g1_i1.p1  ORF type:complete len:178 (-),score=51.96 TRINITY_DN4082_c0_g1_i1:44-577(-)
MKQVARLVSVGINRGSKSGRSTVTSRGSALRAATSRSYATQAFPRVTASQLYWKARASTPMVLLDARPTEKYNGFRVHAFLSTPSSSTTAETFADLPTDKPVFILGDYPDLAGADKVAELVKARGVDQVYVLDAGVDLMKEAGFFYFHDEEVENARIAKEKAEALDKQQAAAAAQKK